VRGGYVRVWMGPICLDEVALILCQLKILASHGYNDWQAIAAGSLGQTVCIGARAEHRVAALDLRAGVTNRCAGERRAGNRGHECMGIGVRMRR
jgi:hypothetical protein